MAHIEEWITVEVPAGAAYEQWTRLSELPLWMAGVERVVEGRDGVTTWTVRLGLTTVTSVTEITEVVHGRRIAWRSVSGPAHEGSVAFVGLDDAGCAVVVEAHGDPAAAPGGALEALGVVRRGVRAALAGFKEAAEAEYRAAPRGAVAA